jgi:hypothetical protein
MNDALRETPVARPAQLGRARNHAPSVARDSNHPVAGGRSMVPTRHSMLPTFGETSERLR